MTQATQTAFDQKLEDLKLVFERADKKGYAKAAVLQLITSMTSNDYNFKDSKQACLKQLRESFKPIFAGTEKDARARRTKVRDTALDVTLSIIKHIQNGEEKVTWDMSIDDLPSYVLSKRSRNAEQLKQKLGLN